MIYIIHCVGLDMKRNTIDDFFTPTVVSGYTKMFGRLEDAKKYVEKIKQNLYFDNVKNSFRNCRAGIEYFLNKKVRTYWRRYCCIIIQYFVFYLVIKYLLHESKNYDLLPDSKN